MGSILQDTRKQEYATKLTLMGVFLSIFAGFVSQLSIWRRKGADAQIKPFDLALLGLATLRLGRLVAYDRITEPLREPFAKTIPDPTGAGETVAPRDGSGVRNSLGQLISCPICSGTWIAAALIYGLHALPNATRVFLSIMSTVGLAEVLNALTEALGWSGQYARALTGAKEQEMRDRQIRMQATIDNLFNSGGNYYVRHDHEEHHRQSGH